MKDIEIEIQAQVENEKPLIEFLEKEGKFQSEKNQIDEYFSPAHKDFLSTRPVNEWLRLRNAEGQGSINYKNWHRTPEGKSHHCDEYETKVENLTTAKKILVALNMKSLVIVDKVRKTWLYQDYEIAIDCVKNLGNFVEIEYKGDVAVEDASKVTKEMVNFLKNIGCGKIELNDKGYPYQLLFGK